MTQCYQIKLFVCVLIRTIKMDWNSWVNLVHYRFRLGWNFFTNFNRVDFLLSSPRIRLTQI